jgi:hypothetical protein
MSNAITVEGIVATTPRLTEYDHGEWATLSFRLASLRADGVYNWYTVVAQGFLASRLVGIGKGANVKVEGELVLTETGDGTVRVELYARAWWIGDSAETLEYTAGYSHPSLR